MSQKKLQIHSENILPIIKKWLYTDKDIFLRELVSNACDAISKTKILRDQGKTSAVDEEFRIDLTLDKEAKTLTIADTGIGMTAGEVEKYIAQLAFSGAEEFVEKYQSDEESSQIIGHFGLGFYSAFMVSDKVDIDTLSYENEAKPAFWTCDGSPEYTLEEGKRESRGTTITLHLTQDAEEFLDEKRVRDILLKHCRFLPYPIYLSEKQINDKEPLWIKPVSECTDQDYIDFYHMLYPFEPDPIFWIHLNVDYPFHLQGILYFPKLSKRFDHEQSSIHLYCNRVFVSDSCKEVIPEHFSILRGVVDSPDIPLNVSRSNLQTDRTVRQLSSHISKKVADKLVSLYQTNREGFIARWPDIELIVKLGILRDEKFYEKIKSCLIWKTSEDTWTTVEEYLERNKEKGENKVFYHQDDKHLSHFFDMYKEKGLEILYAPSHLDTPLMSFLEDKMTAVKFQRLDGALEDVILDKGREKNVLDAEGKTESAKIADFFRSKLDKSLVEVEAKSLASDSVPAFIVIHEGSRRMRDYLSLSGQDIPSGIGEKRTFVVNTNSQLVQSVTKLGDKDPELAKELVHQLYELSLLSQKELDPATFPEFLKRSNAVLEKLSKHAVGG
ncbi:molecular chaperone HtpG [Simkania negevensis]|uniref:Chaperone protein htpG n=1 Tax=Simkania negevensis (strain ATCC VR-1471 / DSM 27360 / Z) TaxID=331113 RepID=F8L6D7_SIMNZ|nr:molecular chaperone HtpG [Simkania negevensis]CCB88267.1 chaperone protein htpG [Simkania negevensis Z]